jgi:4-oxalocrotonate tautomerase family enzyme
MPTIFFYGPELDGEKKRKMVKEFTRAASEATGITEAAFVIYLHSTDHEHVAVGGQLLADRKK